MHRILIVGAIALAILQQSNCLSIQNGKLINKCGIWQYFTNSSIVLLVEDKSDNKSISISENEIRGYGSGIVTLNQNGNNTIISNPSSATIQFGNTDKPVAQTLITQSQSILSTSGTTIITTPRTETISGMIYNGTTSMITASGMYIQDRSPTIIYCGNNNTYNNSACYQGR